MSRQEQVKSLRDKGYSYNQIAKELDCGKSLVAYYLGKGVKEKQISRSKANHYNCKIQKKVNSFKKSRTSTVSLKVSSIKDNYFTKDVLDMVGKDPVCYLTGRKIDIFDTKSWHLDHKVPVSKGGSSELSNMGISCKEANMMKTNLLLDEFLELCKEVLIHNGYKVKKNL